MPKDIRKEIERVIKTIDLTLEQSEEWAKEKGTFFSGSIFGPEVRKALVEVLEITKVTNEAELEPYRQVFVATKTEKHPDKFVTYLGAFFTYEAAQKACDEDLFGGHTRNHQRFHYHVEEMELKS